MKELMFWVGMLVAVMGIWMPPYFVKHELGQKTVAKEEWPNAVCAVRYGMLLTTEGGFVMNNNGTQYKLQQMSPGHCKWVEDVALEKALARDNQHRAQLFLALKTRVLDEKELLEAKNYGSELNISDNVSYNEEAKSRELSDAWLQQGKLRHAARLKYWNGR